MKKLLLILLCLPLLFTTCKKEDEDINEITPNTTTNTPLSTDGEQTYVPDDNFEAFLEANVMGNGVANDDSVALSNINTVTSLTVSSRYISDLTGIEDFTALTYLDCSDNQLTSLDVSQNTALTELDCGGGNGNQLIPTLDVSQNTALTSLECRNLQLTSLDVSQNTALTYLHCGNNLIPTLDVSQNTALMSLNCWVNYPMTSLDVSQNTALIYLYCQLNQLTTLNIGNNYVLTRLHCYSNQLTSLDMRGVKISNFKNGHLPGAPFTNDFLVYNNPNLTCISVDFPSYAEEWWRDQATVLGEEALATDAHCSFSEQCP